MLWKKKIGEVHESNLQVATCFGAIPEGGYVVTCPLLPELITEGEDVQDALKNASEALAAIVDGFKQLKCPLPSALQPAQDKTTLWVETELAV